MLDDAEVARILAITAHPDDVDFSAAGTIARWTDARIGAVLGQLPEGRLAESFQVLETP